LLNILSEGKNHAANSNCGETWSELLDHTTDEGDSVLISRLGKVMGLPHLIVEELEKITDTEEADYKHWVEQVSLAFRQQNLDSNWESFIKYIDPHTMTYLKMNKQILSSHALYQQITEDKIVEMKETIENLMQEVRESDLKLDIQSYLLSSLGKIYTALIEYKITGHLPVMDAIDSTIGHAVTDSDFRENINTSSVGKKIWGTLQGLSVIITVATGVPQLSNIEDMVLILLEKL
jgi:hypothetical protein